MDGMLGPIREGNRGGLGLFRWDDVKQDKHRENYLGHSINAPVGRWQKNKDLLWYSKPSTTAADEPSEIKNSEADELVRIRQLEADAMAEALGYKVKRRRDDTVSDKELKQAVLKEFEDAKDFNFEVDKSKPTSDVDKSKREKRRKDEDELDSDRDRKRDRKDEKREKKKEKKEKKKEKKDKKEKRKLGGTEFPPSIYYKIYTKSNNVHYFSGARIIHPGSIAAKDSCKVMGTRKFTENMVRLMYFEQMHGDGRRKKCSGANGMVPVDVTNQKEFVEYLSGLDELPVQYGGRSNTWRKLSLTPFALSSILFDLSTKNLSDKYSTHGNAEENHPTEEPQRKKKIFVDLQSLTKIHDEENEEFDDLFKWSLNLPKDIEEDYVHI
ncbi:hypothetical protein HK098_005513 [Nowakowskiella sp. JEL0407]|nr:hypothetical protein HK098_005513 [Nowakowskiella sp. JEL0407]